MNDIRLVANAIIEKARAEGIADTAFPFCVERATHIIYQWQTLGDEGVLIKPATPEFQGELRKLPWDVFEKYFKLYEGSHTALLEALADPDGSPPFVVQRKDRR